MATTVSDSRKSAPTSALGAAVPGLPSWGAFGGLAGGAAVAAREERVPELRWPRSVRHTFPRMANDTQLHALMAGTVLPVNRYAWGIDPNGARDELVTGVTQDFNVPLIEDAIAAMRGQRTAPLGRAKNRFNLAKHREIAFRALGLGHYHFEQVGYIGDDGLWHPSKFMPLPPRSIGSWRISNDGGLEWIKQTTADAPKIEIGRLIVYVWDQDPGDWAGRSMYRPCYREWLIKDRLLRVDAINHEKAGGILLNEAPAGATPAEIEKLGELAAMARVGGGGAVPSGTNPVFIRGTGSDVIQSINRHDEAMARAFLLMSIQLGSTQTGARAVGAVQQELWGYSQLAIADWFAGTFNEHAIEDYADWNWGPDEEFVPRLVFVDLDRQQTTPSQDLQNAGATIDAAVQAALDGKSPATVGRLRAQVARESREYRTKLARALPLLFSEEELAQLDAEPDMDAEVEEQLHTLLAEGAPKRTTPPARTKVRAATDQAVSLPDRPLHREPFQHEVQAAVDFAQVDQNWQTTVDALVAEWQAIRTAQIDELAAAIVDAGGDLEAVAQIQATAAGGDLIAARLTAMAHNGAAEAVAEAAAQGVADAAPADLATLEAELAARGAALEQLLSQSLSQAAANKAVQITGGTLSADEVAVQVADYLGALTDTYLADQFGGAISAAQNAGRLATMDENGASLFYASELLDANTCDPCAEIDGTEYSSAEEAAADYPGGGFRDCDGGPRCRGIVVAVYDEAPATVDGTSLARLERRIDDIANRPVNLTADVHLHDERPLEVHVHHAAEEPLHLTLAEGAIHNDIHVDAPAAQRPRKATARRGADGSLEVTYDEPSEDE